MEKLFEVLHAGVSPFHMVEYGMHDLLEQGFTELDYGTHWNLQKGGRYVMNHHGSTLFAFTVGEEYEPGDMIRMAGAHTDYPYLRIKPNPDFQAKVYPQVNLEVYGGAIDNTWLDRPLGIAGRVVLRSNDPFAPKTVLYRSSKPLMVIPNLAIHMNHEVNKGIELNRQIDMMPVLDCLPKEMKTTEYFLNFLAEELGVPMDVILDFELNTYIMEEACYVGIQDTMISGGRLDNMTSCCALLRGIAEGGRKRGINLIALFDHEEVGSHGKQGADSLLLPAMIRRILRSMGARQEQLETDLYNSMFLSVDVAHGLHPNKPNKSDITNQPMLNSGLCIKMSSRQSYATDAQAIAIIRQLCEMNHIPYQRVVNRSDLRGGGTIGAIVSTNVPIKTVDVGVPILAMHSSRELMGAKDQKALEALAITFFKA